MEALNWDTTALRQLIVHYVGSKNNGELLQISEGTLQPGTEMAKQLTDGFLHRFKNIAETYAFHHASALRYHEVYNFCKILFDDETAFAKTAGDMARHLYDASTHPKVKGGEFYVVLFEGVPVESRLHKAVGLFKTENKALFLDVTKTGTNLDLAMKEGVEVTKMDKGCLIIDCNREAGYDVFIFDNQNRGDEARYWKETFLGVTPQKNSFHHTAHLLSLTKEFITGHREGELEKTEQVTLLNKSINYFSENETFDIDDFQTTVFADDETINSFRNFGARYVESHDYDIASNFDISAEAVKRGAKVYKSVLKLDKNFHVYIHGRTDLIERGTDEDGRKYYKLYYQDEA